MRRHGQSRVVTDAEGMEWEVTMVVAVQREDGWVASVGDLRGALPGPVRERLIDDLRNDVERML